MTDTGDNNGVGKQDFSFDYAFDPDALRDRYRKERERRLRADGVEQYRELAGGFADYAKDPHAAVDFSRDPIERATTALIIGGGFGGLSAAAHLKNAGVSDVMIVDKAGDFGGTWYWNRYPGAACDTESYIYLPLLEDLGYLPTEKYARGPEILEHARTLGRHFDLYDSALFHTEVKVMRWDDAALLWRVETNRGDRLSAQFVISVIGALHKPKLPGIPGIETFTGRSFHTSRWDYEYTGGDAEGNMTGLAGKRVGIIGTGATAVQCVPYLAEDCEHLFVFQRTPSVVDVRNNRPTETGWSDTLKPGWQRERMANFNVIVSGGQADEDLVNDGWTDLLGKFLIIGDAKKQKAADPKMMELIDFEKMEKVRARVDALVNDSKTAELLKPYYSLFCKRPCFHDEYLQTFNRENVTLVDTRGAGVERVTPSGVVVSGIEYSLDCIVYATGFEVGTPYTRRGGFEVYGKEGLSLAEKWMEGPETLHGFFTRGFPNFIVISQLQGGAAANFTHMLDEQARHVAYVVETCKEQNIAVIEPEENAEEDWVNEILKLGERRKKYNESCTPGYYNNEGQVTDEALKNAPYGGGSVGFIDLMQKWRAAGDMAGLELTPSRDSAFSEEAS